MYELNGWTCPKKKTTATALQLHFRIATSLIYRFSSKKGFNFSRASQSTPDGEKHSDLLFSAVPGKKRDVDYEWRNGERCLLATESDGKDSRSLMLHVKMSTEDRDALVSAWMLRAWWEQTEGNCPKHLDDIGKFDSLGCGYFV
ncbi:hypothetical protein MAN_10678, partial [Metarhizium hybridum]